MLATQIKLKKWVQQMRQEFPHTDEKLFLDIIEQSVEQIQSIVELGYQENPKANPQNFKEELSTGVEFSDYKQKEKENEYLRGRVNDLESQLEELTNVKKG